MAKSFLPHRICFASAVLLCLGISGLYARLPVHASSAAVLAKGTSGGCVWEYRRDGDEVVLAIRPIPKTSGESGGASDASKSGGASDAGESGGASDTGEFDGASDAGESGGASDASKSGGASDASKSDGASDASKSGGASDASKSDGATDTAESGVAIGTLGTWEWIPPWSAEDLKQYRVATKRVVVEQPVKALTCYRMFSGFIWADSFDLSQLDTGAVTNMKDMFSWCDVLKRLDVSMLNTAAVTAMDSMFRGCHFLASVEGCNRWDTSSVKTMKNLFANCESLKQIDLHTWVTDQVTDMRSAFENCLALASLDIENWSTTSVIEMTDMFRRTPSLEDVCFGHAFHLMNDANFDHAGRDVGTHWVYVENGTKDNPTGEVFMSIINFTLFQNSRLAKRPYRYVRQAVSEAVCGDCIWRYVPLDKKDEKGQMTYALHIFPREGQDGGMLANWENTKDATPSWRRYPCRVYYLWTTDIVIEKGKTNDEPVKALTCREMFEGFPRLTTVDISGLDTKYVKNASNMFCRCSNLTSFVGLGTRNFRNVQDMSGMFSFCRKLAALDANHWNTAGVTNMSRMFRGCYALRSLDLSTWDTTALEDASFMFNYCRSLVDPGVNKWNTASLMRADGMFAECLSLPVLDLGSWTTAKLTSAIAMFQNCYVLASVGNLGSWNTAAVTSMNMMFYCCRALAALDLSGWDTTALTSMRNMFWRTLSLGDIRLGNKFHLTRDSNFNEIGTNVGTYWVYVKNGTKEDPDGKVFATSADFLAFHNSRKGKGFSWYVRQEAAKGICGSCAWEYVSIPKDDEDAETTYELHIRPREGNAFGTLRQWRKKRSAVAPWRCLPRSNYYSSTTKVVIDKPVKASTCEGMFKDFTKLETADITGLDTSAVETTRGMFQGCNKLTTLKGIGTRNTNSVKDMCRMFADCHDLASLDIGAWNTSSATNMRGMFRRCHALSSLDMSGWDTSSVADMAGMFWETSQLKKIRVSRAFHIADTARFDHVGKNVDTHWMQVSSGDNSKEQNPRHRVFPSSHALTAFHNKRTKREAGFEQYARITPRPLTIIFDKGADDATDSMTPQVFACDEAKRLQRNAYKRIGYVFDGWKDSDGKRYADAELFVNACGDEHYRTERVFTAQWKAATCTLTFDRNVRSEQDARVASPDFIEVVYGQKVRIPSEYYVTRGDYAFLGWNTEADGSGTLYKPGDTVEPLIKNTVLYAQWAKKEKITITYRVSKRTKRGTISRESEMLSVDTGRARGSEALPHAGYVFYRWTCDIDKSWSCQEPVLASEQVEAIAKRTGSFVKTTFTAHFKKRRYCDLVFDSNIPYAEGSSASTLARLHARCRSTFTIPARNFPTRANYFFTSWNTEPDGTGTSYKSGEKINSATNIKVLYAQWAEKPKVTIRYIAKKAKKKGTVSRASEKLLADTGIPEGSQAQPLPGYAFYRWTCNTDPSWSCTEPFLTKEQIERVAKKTGTFAATTFTAHFKERICIVRFDQNTSDNAVTSAVDLDQIGVRYGKDVFIPTAYHLTRKDYVFLGWNTQPDGMGMSYEPGETIGGVIDDIVLYAQWAEKDKVRIRYVVKGRVKRGRVSRTSEVLSADTGIAEGATAVPFEGCRFKKWTCATFPSWTYTGPMLTKGLIERLAKKTGSFVPVTFVAHFTGRIKR